MSAGERWHEDAPKKNGEPILPEARLSLMSSPGSGENFASIQEQFSKANEHPAPDSLPIPDRDQTLAALLNAIESTDVARRLGGVVPEGNRQSQPPAFAVWANNAEVAPEPPAPAVRRRSAAASPASTRLVQTPPRAASAPLMPSPTAPNRRPPSRRRSKPAEPLPAAAASVVPPPASPAVHEPPPLATPRIAAAAGPGSTRLIRSPFRAAPTWLMPHPDAPSRQSTSAALPKSSEALPVASARTAPPLAGPVVHQPRPPAMPRMRLVQDSNTSRRLMPPATAPSLRPAPALPASAERLSITAAPRLTSPPQLAPISEPAPAATTPRASASVESAAPGVPKHTRRSADISRIAAKTAEALRPTAQALTQLAKGSQNWLATNVPLVLKRVRRTGAQLSISLKNWAQTQAAPGVARTCRAGMRIAVSLNRWAGREAAFGFKRIGRAGTQAAISLKHWSQSEAALAGKRRSQAGAQLSAALKPPVESKPAQITQSVSHAKTQVATGLKTRFGPRRLPRMVEPPVVAYCWAADTPQALRIADISTGGLHLLTDVRWPLGATVPVTLQRTDRPKEAPESWIVIDFMILRWCKDGLAGTLNPPTPYSVASGAINCADRTTLKRFVKQLAVPARR